MAFSPKFKNALIGKVHHRVLKTYAVETNQNMVDIMNTALSEYLEKEMGAELYQILWNRAERVHASELNKTQNVA